jgi:TPR repeat protein
MLGGFYIQGQGVEQSYDLGFKFHMMSARRGFDNGCYNIAACYSTGKGAPGGQADIEKCLEWMKKAADKGHRGASEALPRLQRLAKETQKKKSKKP